jgi:hypothetical protein
MALPRAIYRPRDAEHTVLHQVVAEHLEAFMRVEAASLMMAIRFLPD